MISSSCQAAREEADLGDQEWCRALCLPARSIHQPGQWSPRQKHRRPDAMGICPSRETSRDEFIKDSFLSYQQVSAPSGTPMRKPEINGAQTAHTMLGAGLR